MVFHIVIPRVRQVSSTSNGGLTKTELLLDQQKEFTSGSLSQEERENKRLSCTQSVSSSKLANHINKSLHFSQGKISGGRKKNQECYINGHIST